VRFWSSVVLSAFFLLSTGTGVALPVTGGAALRIDVAPWAVLITRTSGSGAEVCGGSILDPAHVLTAAHCLYDASGTQASSRDLFVRAGISNARSPLTTDAEQSRAVSSARVFPGYTWTGGASSGDVAVLTLAQPLALVGSAFQAVALPPAGTPYPAGAQATLAGFGREFAGVPSNGSLQLFSGTVNTQTACGAIFDRVLPTADDTGLCASSPSSSICSGDSGSGLVTVAAPRTLIGVVSSGRADCAAGSDALFTYVGAPDIRTFLAANTATPAITPRTGVAAASRTNKKMAPAKRRAAPTRTQGSNDALSLIR
jgi:secreted trypsin-like serine protease